MYRVLTIFLILISSIVHAQYFYHGQNPASKKWHQIETSQVQVIFPEGTHHLANRVVNTVIKVYESADKTMQTDIRPISIILQNDQVSSNGFVTWAPWRSEYYTTPPQDNDVIHWLDKLAVHESRHVIQLSKLNQGMTKVMYYLMGEQGVGLALGLTIPPWWLEGDATLTETLLTNAGRGRLPFFNMRVRAQLMQDSLYSYEKASFGSYKDYVPSIYHQGYFMTAYARRQYGAHVWDSTLTLAGRRFLWPFRFSTALKKTAGISTKELYKQSYTEIDSLWKVKNSQVDSLYDAKPVTANKQKTFTDYTLPRFLTNDQLIALKSGYADVPQIVQLTDSTEEVVKKTGPVMMDQLSTNGNKIVWAETYPDVRWGYRNFSDIIIQNTQTGKRRRLTKKSRLFVPDISPDGNKIVAVEVDSAAQSHLVVLNAETGKELNRKTVGHEEQFKMPRWNHQGNRIVFIHYTSEGNSLVVTDSSLDMHDQRFGPSQAFIAGPVLRHDTIYFRAPFDGRDNLYAHADGQLFQLTTTKTGIFSPDISPDGRHVVYREYMQSGSRIHTSPVKKLMWRPEAELKYVGLDYYKPLLEQEDTLVLEDVPDSSHAFKKYPKWKHLVNIHSWQPAAYSINEMNEPTLGAAIVGQNELSSAFTILDYSHDPAAKIHRGRAEWRYAGWYPEISLSTNYSVFQEQQVRVNEEPVVGQFNIFQPRLEVSLPLRLTRGYWRQWLTLAGSASWRNVRFEGGGYAFDWDYIPAGVRAVYTIQSPRAKRDVAPHWGLSVSGGVNTLLNAEGIHYRGFARVFLPGVGRHHSFRPAASLQYQASDNFALAGNQRLPRGYFLDGFLSGYQLSADYELPLFYPDWNLWFLWYLQRVRVNMFYDYADGTILDSQHQFQSVGADWLFDVNLLRYWFDIELGVRNTWRIGPDSFFHELIFNIGF